MQVFTWVNGLEYQGVKLAFSLCEETVDEKTTTFAFLTNFTGTPSNVEIIAQGGRIRGTIENQGFNEQKTGYEREHFCDGNNRDVMLNRYYRLQIAHRFMPLLAKSGLIEGVTHRTFLACLLLEALRNLPLPEERFDPNPPRCQIRFPKAPP